MAEHHDEEHFVPGPSQYVEIGIILAVLTSIEVGFYIFRESIPDGIKIPGLLVLTVIKFLLVVLWFMHLRFDHKLFRRVFFVGVLLATAVFGVLGANFYLGSPGF